MTVIMGIDPALGTTGVTRIEMTQLGAEITVGRVTSRPPKPEDVTLYTRSQRLRKLAQDTTQRCVGASLVVIEGPAYNSTSGSAFDRHGYWWMIVGRLTGAGFNVVEVPPNSLKTYALGKGAGAGTGKDDVLSATVRRYTDVQFSGNDEADSLIVAAMGARFIGCPIDDHPKPLAATYTRALKGVKWNRNPATNP